MGVLLSGCGDEDTDSNIRLNSADDVVQVEVGVAEVLEARSIELHSNTGAVVVGSATITPGGGPSGTLHQLTVQLTEDFYDEVDRVSVRTDSGARGEDEYELVADLALEGFYSRELQSVADEGEVRTDTLELLLWQDQEARETQDSQGADDTGAAQALSH